MRCERLVLTAESKIDETGEEGATDACKKTAQVVSILRLRHSAHALTRRLGGRQIMFSLRRAAIMGLCCLASLARPFSCPRPLLLHTCVLVFVFKAAEEAVDGMLLLLRGRARLTAERAGVEVIHHARVLGENRVGCEEVVEHPEGVGCGPPCWAEGVGGR